MSQQEEIFIMTGLYSFICFPNKAWFLPCLLYKCFENTVGKGEITRNEQLLLFPQFFLLVLENFMPFSSDLKLLASNSLSLESLKLVVLERVYPSQDKSEFKDPCGRELENVGKGKMLVNNIFSMSHDFYTPTKRTFLGVCLESEDNVTMSSMGYFENHASYFVQN